MSLYITGLALAEAHFQGHNSGVAVQLGPREGSLITHVMLKIQGSNKIVYITELAVIIGASLEKSYVPPSSCWFPEENL